MISSMYSRLMKVTLGFEFVRTMSQAKFCGWVWKAEGGNDRHEMADLKLPAKAGKSRGTVAE